MLQPDLSRVAIIDLMATWCLELELIGYNHGVFCLKGNAHSEEISLVFVEGSR